MGARAPGRPFGALSGKRRGRRRAAHEPGPGPADAADREGIRSLLRCDLQPGKVPAQAPSPPPHQRRRTRLLTSDCESKRPQVVGAWACTANNWPGVVRTAPRLGSQTLEKRPVSPSAVRPG